MRLNLPGALALAVALCVSGPLRAQCPAGGAQVELEPNGTAALATPVALWAFDGYFVGVRGAIDSPGDVDTYRFQTAAAGTRVWLVVDTGVPQTGASSRDTVVTLLDSDGSTLLEEDDDDGTGNGRDATIESLDASVIAGRQLGDAGSYYLRVRAKNPGDVISRYVLAVGITTGTLEPESEPNDLPAQAQPAFGVVQGSLSSASDVDWYNVGVLDVGFPMVIVDGDPERDGTSTDVVLRMEGFSGNLQTDSSSGNGQPAPGAEGFVMENFGANVRITGSGPGSYRFVGIYSGKACPVPVELQSFSVQ